MSLKKDAYYFPHFSNARNDRKLKRVRKELGVEGYGIYFMLLEVLREQTNFSFPLNDVDLLADDLGTSEQKVRTVVANYDLFEIDQNEQFFSANLLKYLEPYFQRKQHARIAAKKRWNKELTDNTEHNPSSAREMPEHTPSNAGIMQSKVKYSKVNNSKVNGEENEEDKQTTEAEQLMYQWYNTYNKTLTRQVAPGNKDQKNAYDLLDRVDLETALKAVDIYFTASEWPQYDAKKNKWNYNFASFCANIETVLSQEPDTQSEDENVFTDDDLIDIGDF